MSTELNEITKAIKSRKHPDYEEFHPQWQFFEDSYRGGRQWFDTHLFKYHKEGETEFEDRKARAYRFNHAKEVVELVGRYLFRANIHRSENAPEEVKAFWKRMSKRGWDVDESIPVLSKWASVFGRIWVVVDATKVDGEVVTQRDLKDANYRVFTYHVRPQDVMDMAYNEDDGQLDWILIRESYRDSLSPLLEQSSIRERFRLWTRNVSVLYEYDYTNASNKDNLLEREPVEHGLGMVPVVPLDDQSSSDDYTSTSLIADIAYLDRAVANYLSNLDAIIQDQTFSQLAMPAQAAIFGDDDETTAQRNNMIEVGKKRVFLYDGEGGGEPHYLSPDPKQAELIIKAIRQIINEIYHSVGVAGERTKQDNAQGIDNSSGVAKAYDFDRINSLLSSKGKVLERFENRVLNLVLAYHGTTYEGEKLVKYPDTYDTRGYSDELNILERMEVVTTPLELRQHQLKRVVKKLYPHLTEQEARDLESAIDEMEDLIDSLVANSGKNRSDSDPSSDALPNEQNQDDAR